ncbi:MAG TPA: peptide-methionine (R)-S-oxide reductase MsrB [Caulobacteraceae bacterium]|jgi:peptide-methionine (R)-S-oxide reductase|nr:peptide-methionine (R)-S-oxide reductase MsrB [Caulobacteraceae bacterium]
MTDMNRRGVIASAATAALAAAFGRAGQAFAAPTGAYPVSHTPAQWRALLKPEAYRVLREQGTETAYTSPLLNEHRRGVFACAGCDQAAFASSTKYDSHTGWPSFWTVLPHATGSTQDRSLFMSRTEVHCSRCGGHLGHVFDDGPRPTGLRYCMNGAALTFHAA